MLVDEMHKFETDPATIHSPLRNVPGNAVLIVQLQTETAQTCTSFEVPSVSFFQCVPQTDGVRLAYLKLCTLTNMTTLNI